jgi:hypothetical protein
MSGEIEVSRWIADKRILLVSLLLTFYMRRFLISINVS